MHIRLGVERRGRNRKVQEFKARKCALDQLAHAFGRADFDEFWRLAEKHSVSDRGANAKDPAGTPEATLVFYVG